ncbi:single-stranded DNA-binding protein [Myxacorys almedinensis]|uniref:Single-stranded DNA-binding protein n=1 Tax=Myxacorys almedinensis A TaxID=2690445 RepID=A0A8J7Z325_9CYAN|nr:single-stranded DNA-binding protein [Myxacorys almedinensis]NDJ19109.1 single-stranded DNA-binding protein [Myxacorys almedinensis A]
MNSCILLAELLQDPQLRYTPDNQTPIAEMQVQFAGLRPEDPPVTLKAVGWGNMAQEIQGNYHQGDRVILEGRLSMNTVDRPEGFKEKRAELTIQKIYTLDGASIGSVTTASAPSASSAPPAASKPKAAKAAAAPAPADQPELDDIPF